MLSPICPHYCENLWGLILGNSKDGARSVMNATWPAAGVPDATLLASDAYLTAQMHHIRLSIIKASGTKASKMSKGGTATLARPTSVNIFVAATWPEWQRSTLVMLREAWSPAVHGDANSGFPADIVNRVKDAAQADAALRPFLKKIMPLASLTVQGMKGRAEPSPELDLRMPFDEFAVWNDNIDYVRKSLELPGAVRVIRSDDASGLFLDPLGKIKEALPLEPTSHPFVE